MCTRALVTKFTPDGPRVSVACVGDNIGDDADFRTAIAACQEEQAAETAATSSGETAEPTPTESAGDDGESTPVDIGPLAWDADMTLRDGSSLTPSGDQWISITRTAGSDEFTASARVATTSVTDFFEIGECTTILEKTFSGSGTFDPDIPTRLVIPGEQFVDWQYPDCGGIAENDNTKPFDLIVQITETGISGGFEGFEFEADGRPVPVNG